MGNDDGDVGCMGKRQVWGGLVDRWCEQETGVVVSYCISVDFPIVCLKSSLLLLLGAPRTLVRGYYA